MKLITFIQKDGSKIDVMCQKSFNDNHVGDMVKLFYTKEYNCYNAFYYNWEEFLKVNDITECFDTRYLRNIQGKSNTIILENDTIVPEDIYKLAEYTSSVGFHGNSGNIFRPFLDLAKSSNKEGYDKYLYDYIIDNKIKNVFIDSIFKDRTQFEFIAKNVFRWTVGVNVLIYSHNLLLDILNEYTLDEEIKRTLNVCNIYEIDFDNNIASKIEYDYVTSKFIHKTNYSIKFLK